ncbi:MAG: hypothetical protein GKS00_29675 [Alphaproteobacteria bacterium]|nr:hypothetical protein [Alphaproteobacteria bacterium]
MKEFLASCRHKLGNPLIRGLCITGGVFGVYILSAVAMYVAAPRSKNDPIYLLTDITRREQILGASAIFGIVVLILLIRHFGRSGQALDFASDTTVRRGCILLLILISMNGIGASLSAIVTELNSQFWTPLFGWVAVVLGLQALVLYGLLRWTKRPWVHLVLMVALSMINLDALHLSLLGDFLTQPEVVRIPIITFLVLGLVSLFGAVGKGMVPARVVNAILVLTMLGPAASLGFTLFATAPADAKRMSPFSGIAFHTRPNIHIVAFDALSPVSLAKKHLGLADVPYARLLAGEGRVGFKNAFASQAPTQPSLNSLMRLAHADFANEWGLFAGRADGPVTHILRSNGYKVSTGFEQLLFGDKGRFVDAYLPEPTQSVRNSTLCALAADRPLKFFGFCALGATFGSPAHDRPWPEKVIDVVRRSGSISEAGPEFTLHYIYDPIGHTGAGFRSTDREALARYAAYYHRRSKEVVRIMEQVQEIVRNDKAPSILILMGDHGPYVSRTVLLDEEKAFFVRDRYGIFAAVLVNETDCTAKQLQHYSAPYATPARILAGAMRCLARDPARLDAAMKFKEAHAFENFLYE